MPLVWRELFTRAAVGRSGASKQLAPQRLPHPGRIIFSKTINPRLNSGAATRRERQATLARRNLSVLFAKIYAHHSWRSDTIGSTFAARRAGMKQASSDTMINNNAIEPNVSGSVALTPFNIGIGKIELVKTRVSARAKSKPALKP